MKLHELKPSAGSKTARKRVGRGAGSGTGKTSGSGHNGQNSRSGGGVRRGFEGGQMPLARRLPKIGFTNIFRVEYEVVNVGDLQKLEIAGDITPELLVQNGLVRKNRKIKILGDGQLDKQITITANKFSKSAREKIEKAGGKAVAL